MALPPQSTLSDLDRSIDFTPLWQLGLTGRGIRVAIVDSGINLALDEKSSVVMARDFTPDQTPETDELGHGSKVATMVRNIAPQAKLVNLKALSNNLPPDRAWAKDAIYFCIDSYPDIRVINISLWFDPTPCPSMSCPLCEAVSKAFAKGIVVVAAAGNKGPTPGSVTCPGVCREAITVGASWPTSTQLWWDDLSSWKKWWLTITGELGSRFGTSFSAPTVSGIIALLLEAFPQATPQEIKAALKQGAAPLAGSPQGSGSGQVSGRQAFAILSKKYGYALSPAQYLGAKRALHCNSENLSAQESSSPYLQKSLQITLDYLERNISLDLDRENTTNELKLIASWIKPGCFLQERARIDALSVKLGNPSATS